MTTPCHITRQLEKDQVSCLSIPTEHGKRTDHQVFEEGPRNIGNYRGNQRLASGLSWKSASLEWNREWTRRDANAPKSDAWGVRPARRAGRSYVVLTARSPCSASRRIHPCPHPSVRSGSRDTTRGDRDGRAPKTSRRFACIRGSGPLAAQPLLPQWDSHAVLYSREKSYHYCQNLKNLP